MDSFEIQKLRALPIEGVAARLGLQVTRHKALCPFHPDSHPSLTFNVARNSYRCFVCGQYGGVIDLAMKLLNKPFVEACQWLADEHNIILTQHQPAVKPTAPRRQFDATRFERCFEHPVLNAAAVDFLFGQRKLDRHVVEQCRLNSCVDRRGRSWLQIPYYDVEGRLMGVQWRNLDYRPPVDGKEEAPRFRFPYGSTCHIYNLPVLRTLAPGEPLYITEGASDCWSMLSAGHKAIAIPSATLLNKGDLAVLTGQGLSTRDGAPSTLNPPLSTPDGALSTLNPPLSTLNWHMYPDADVPGERLYIQLVQLANQVGASLTRHSLPAGCKDYSEWYVRGAGG